MHSRQDHPMDPPQRSGPNGAKPRRCPRTFWLAAGVVACLVTGGVVAGIVPRARRQAELKAGTAGRPVPIVRVVSPAPGLPGPALPLPAEVRPWVEAPIHARASGYLERRLVDIGARVEAGQLLAEIDTPELDQELERARARVAQAEAALELAEATAARWARARETASVSEQEHAEKQADVKLKTALAASARAEVGRLENLRAFARVTAPFPGTVTVRNVDTGDLIAAAGGQELVAEHRGTVLAAFAEVENNLAAEHLLANEYEKQLAAMHSARRQLEISSNRYEAGLVTYLDVAAAQHIALSAERASVCLRGRQLVEVVALIKALGGGWQAPVSPSDTPQASGSLDRAGASPGRGPRYDDPPVSAARPPSSAGQAADRDRRPAGRDHGAPE